MERELYDSLYRLEDEHWWFRGRRAVIRSLLRHTPSSGPRRILDAGCGTGRNLVELAEFGQASGVDGSQQAVDYCLERGLERVQRAPLESLPYESESFDLVLLADVIEHVDDDVAVLKELRRVTKPHGAIVITTPAYRWLWSHQDESHHHRRRYTRGGLAERALESGWSPSLGTYFNSILLLPIAIARKLLRRWIPDERSDFDITPRPLNGALALPMRAESALIRAGARLPFGVSIGMVCEAAPDPAQASPGGAGPTG